MNAGTTKSNSRSWSSTSQALATLLATDGVHFTAEGYRIWYNLMLQTVRQQCPSLRSENLKTVFPHIFDVDAEKLPASLWQNREDEQAVKG
jgi:hypothetical protein